MASLPVGPRGAVVSKFTGTIEKNNHLQGRSGAETMKKSGPSAGKTMGNSANSGGINRATKNGGQ